MKKLYMRPSQLLLEGLRSCARELQGQGGRLAGRVLRLLDKGEEDLPPHRNRGVEDRGEPDLAHPQGKAAAQVDPSARPRVL